MRFAHDHVERRMFDRPLEAADSAPLRNARQADDDSSLLKFELNQDGNARRVKAHHGEDIRYCHPFKRWLFWDGRRWKRDESGYVWQLARGTMVEFLRQAADGLNSIRDFANSSCYCGEITGALHMLEGELTITTDELDTDPFMLNFSNGVVDLRTGTLHPHRREDYITKLVHHPYTPEAACPTFLAFLESVTRNDPDLIDYLQKAIGYSLTGCTIEKVVFLLYGSGNNGKSTLLTLLLGLLDEYATLIQINTLMSRQESSNTQADLADLRGARFVMTSETEQGQCLAEGKLKRITQGMGKMGKIKAVRKYENPIEFPETHKLWIDANHRPVVRGTDSAIWNRLHPVPFDVTIPKAEQDRDLQSKLLEEAEGILAWAVAGAVRWHSEGLDKPAVVKDAVESWRAESDEIAEFLDECCAPFRSVPAQEFYDRYVEWAKSQNGDGARLCSTKEFSRRVLLRTGIEKKKTKTENVYEGVCLRRPGGPCGFVGFTMRDG